MTEADLLERTRTLASQVRLLTFLGLGETWLIALAASSTLPSVATERYEESLAELQRLFPEDVFDLPYEHRTAKTRYLLLRVGSPVVAHWLRRKH